MGNVDSQVQVRITDLAWDILTNHTTYPDSQSANGQIKAWTENFDKTYKALIKTVES